MERFRTLLKLFFLCLPAPILSGASDAPLPPHPRILLFDGEEDAIRKSIENNEPWRKMHEAIVAESDNIIDLPPVERELIGRRLLGQSREALRRIFYLSYSYRMTGEDKYFERAEREMLSAAAFSDWNPSHFLDVGEMTMALAIGYDWLYHELSPESRKTIREAIVTKGIEPSFDDNYNWFLRSRQNWNQVGNAGMTFGALAVHDHYPELAKEVIDRAYQTIVFAMDDYNPDGAYPEGFGYWGYGTSFNVMFLSAVDKIWPERFDYETYSAFLETGSFRKSMITPTLRNFNWGDNSPGAYLSPAMFWFAEKQERPSLLWKEKFSLGTDDYSRFTRNRLLPGIMIWGKNIYFDNIAEPGYLQYTAQGKMPLTLIRTSWSDPEALYLGFKGGSPSVPHGHMDIGSFIVEADGVRWASDLGPQNYNSLESLGFNIWDLSQNSDRWKIFRLNNFSHNTLTVNGELQRAEGYSKIDRHSFDEDFAFAVSDISSLYSTTLESLVRGAGIVNSEWFIVQDELETGTEEAVVRWQMLTEAEVVLNADNSALLKRDGRELLLRADEPSGVEVTTWSTQTDTNWDVANPGTTLVGFEIIVPANTAQTLKVVLIPGSSSTDAIFDKSLEEW